MLRAAKHWNRLHKVVMDSLSLETFSVRLNQALVLFQCLTTPTVKNFFLISNLILPFF